jgi:putative transposase
MVRPLRIQFHDAWYHVMNRGRNKECIFRVPSDYQTFIDLLKESSVIWQVRIAAYSLMPNHYHLLIQTPNANISRCMRHINGIYTQRFNRAHGSDGQLFRGRYKSILIDGDNYLLELVKYIHCNPLRAGLVKSLDDYPWSSHKGYISQDREGEWIWLYKEFILSILECNEDMRHKTYKAFIDNEEPESLMDVYSGDKLPTVLGAKDFIDRIRKKHYHAARCKDIPESISFGPDITEIKNEVSRCYNIGVEDFLKKRRGIYNEARNVAMFLIRKYTGASLEAIGKQFGMTNYSSVSSTIVRIKQRLNTDAKFQDRVSKIENLLV